MRTAMEWNRQPAESGAHVLSSIVLPLYMLGGESDFGVVALVDASTTPTAVLE